MKKFFCSVLALVLSAAAVGCNDKKKPESEEEDIPVMTDTLGDNTKEDTGTVGFSEFSDSDFKTINVTVRDADGEAPVSVKRIDLSGVVIEDKVPVCYNAENVEEHIKKHNTYYYTDEDGVTRSYMYDTDGENGIPLYDWHDFLDKPVKGYIEDCYVRGNDCFIYVMYQVPLSASCYDHAVFRYDTESGETEEIYSWSAANINETTDGNCLFTENAVFLVYYNIIKEDSPRTVGATVKRLDLDTKEIKTVFEGNDYISSASFMCDKDGSVYFNKQEENDSGQSSVNVYKYDEESGKFGKVDEIVVSDEVKANIISNGKRYSLVKPEGKRKLDMVCDNYRIGTDVTNAKIVYADDKSFVLQNDDQLNVYNIVKKEHYVLDVSRLGQKAVMSDGKLFIGLGDTSFEKPLYCVIPELGLTYKIIDSGIYDDMKCINGKVCFNGRHRETVEYISDDGLNKTTHQFDVIDSVYVAVSR